MSKGHQTFHKGLKTKTTVLSKSAVLFFAVIRLGGMFAPCISGFSHGNEGGRERERGHKGWQLREHHRGSPAPALPPGVQNQG